jgi:allophanate hydrolase subunit 2
MRAIRILETGWLSSIQDHGRAGWGHLGVPPSGAIDIALAAQMNRIVGNPEHS